MAGPGWTKWASGYSLESCNRALTHPELSLLPDPQNVKDLGTNPPLVRLRAGHAAVLFLW